ncbi:MAG: PD-(D/E)XK nuclease domain-containing protein, partial [Bacteroidales bacterium]|nr:PD-(D/E)XK nuclease domain-containing protein [Bacteroidales bacterium]
EAAHDENTSILSYNNENSLACVLSIAYYYAKNDYVVHRELATGKGFADLVMVPRKNVDSPALVVELKFNKDADAAIDQIKRKDYPAKLEQYAGNLLLVGINYDKDTKTHSCRIERV